jgi:hypothetical protein
MPAAWSVSFFNDARENTSIQGQLESQSLYQS